MNISGANKKDNLEVLNNNLDIKNLEIRKEKEWDNIPFVNSKK